MKYKLLLLDVDGTILDSQRQLSKHTISTLRKVQQMGIRVALASGRPEAGLQAIVKDLDLATYDGYVISNNGARVVSSRTDEVIFQRSIDPTLLPYLEKKSNKLGLTMACYLDNDVVSTDISNPYVVEEAQLNGMGLREVPKLSDYITQDLCKVILIHEDEQVLLGFQEHANTHLSGLMDTIHSRPSFLEFVGYQVGKSYAMSALVQKLGISLSEVLAIGDGEADINMLQMAGTGVAMGNAMESVRRCADYVTLSNDQDGAAVAIEKALMAEARQTEVPIDALNAQSATTLMGNLGIQYTVASAQRVEATMPVDHRTRQPFGILHGGATLALAETVAGLGSMIACKPDETVVGMQVSGNHVSSAHEGDTVRAVCLPVHLGRSSHVWNVDIFTSTGRLVSSVRVVNSVMRKR